MHFQPRENMGDEETLSHGGADLQPEVVNDVLDDVFGGEDDEHHAERSHPSDMRRLENEHATAGYRDGVDIGKQETLQKGFDEGYPMGAAIGLQAGQILGIFEGIAEALKGRNDDEATAKADKLLADAREDLSVERLFSGDYWTPTIDPSYDVDQSLLHTNEGALAHPLIRKWTDTLDEQTRLWKIDRTILDHGEPIDSAAPQKTSADEPLEHGSQTVPQDALDW